MNLNPIAIGIRWAGGGVYSPSLFLDFANTSLSLDSRITFSRASNATYFDSTGTLQTAGNNVARSNAFQDYNPSTLAPLGFLIEEQRTNSIRNNTMQGGSAGVLPTNYASSFTIDGLTLTISAPSSISGIEYIDLRINGTTTNARTNIALVVFETTTQVAASSGQTWTNSSFVSLAAGSMTNVTSVGIQISERNGAGAYLVDSTTLFTPLASALPTQRQSVTRTLNQATTAYVQPTVVVSYSSGAAIDITLRIGLPQLEQGAFATSVIKTTAAAATRLADSASITGANFTGFWNATEGTIVADSSTQSSTGNSFAIQVSDNSYNNRIVVGQDASTAVGQVIVAGSVTLTPTSNPARTSSMRKTAFSFIANRANLAAGGTLATADTTGAMVTGMTQINFGSDHAGFNSLNGRLKSVAYYLSALSDPTIQSLNA
ncbi:hypothetical protein UFOVP412_15 [uncultured Caudovirales phage]|uniref:Uncharacterized protein n=1 Tax=uncultured Caudovirales phage TaxID=2100421 RepID=A0A6J5MBM0_9CAUD|nr:hypothetical protein UFOVP412_15 [uncultured Caudovirales phage]